MAQGTELARDLAAVAAEPTQSPKQAQRAQLPSLTGMRFIAAALVFFYHVLRATDMFASANTRSNYGAVFGNAGTVGVGFFFILSGFVLTWSARSTDTAPKFWRRRFFKIYPNYLLTSIAALMLVTLASNQTVTSGNVLANVFLVESWFPQVTKYMLNPVAWSLSCEALFYLSFPLLLKLIARIRPERLWLWATGVIAAVFAVPLVGLALPSGGFKFPFPPASENYVWFVYMFPPVRCLDFAFGMILARMVITRRRIPLGVGGATALALISYLLIPLFPVGLQMVAVTIVPMGLVIAAGAATDLRGHSSWLSSRVMVWLGNVSFAFYMCHFLILTYGHQWLANNKPLDTPAAIGLVALLFGAVLVVSWLLYSLVEHPVMRRFSTARRRAG
jgi:mycarose O-acyltransferase